MNPFTSAVSEISGNPVHIAGLPLTLGFIADFAGLHAQPEADVLIYAMFMAVCVLFAVCINLHVTFPTKEITDISFIIREVGYDDDRVSADGKTPVHVIEGVFEWY